MLAITERVRTRILGVVQITVTNASNPVHQRNIHPLATHTTILVPQQNPARQQSPAPASLPLIISPPARPWSSR